MTVYIVVPYRNREEQLQKFVEIYSLFLFDYNIRIIIVEQGNNDTFNRGIVKNIGYDFICKNYNITNKDIFVLNDLDTIPNDNLTFQYNNQINDNTIHHVFGFKNMCLGGVLRMKFETFKKCNGFPNNFWGWGGEDTCLMKRCEKLGINIDNSNIIEVGSSLVKDLGRPTFEKFDQSMNWSHVCYSNAETLEMLTSNGLSNLTYKINNIKELTDRITKLTVDFEHYIF
jgi:hypothetical protein